MSISKFMPSLVMQDKSKNKFPIELTAASIYQLEPAGQLEALKAKLDAAFSTDVGSELSRESAILVLSTLIEGLRPTLDQHLGTLETGEVIVTDHPAMRVLDQLKDAIKDLDLSKTHPALRPNSYGAPNTLTRAEQKFDTTLLEAVLILQRIKGFSNRNMTERKLASILRGKIFRRSAPITAQRLKQIRDQDVRRNKLL